MKKRILTVLGSGLLLFLSGYISLAADNFQNTCDKPYDPAGQQQKKDTTVKVVYTCPMHPEIVRDAPGKCPKCGMDLKAKEVKIEVYTCPMHPEILSDKPGKCPKCGIDLVKKTPPKKSGS